MSLQLFNDITQDFSKKVTRSYSTSFSLGISLLSKEIQKDIYAVYAYVRLADEIVDTFHDYNKEALLDDFITQTYKAIDEKISLNPVLHQFQITINNYQIDKNLIDTFLSSMRMDLNLTTCTRESYEQYIVGSAEVVGLICLQIFLQGDKNKYEELSPYARRLGAAFQKINFLRDLKADSAGLGRRYFPQWKQDSAFDENIKAEILNEIKEDFKIARQGICMLPANSKLGVYAAYVYYKALLLKINRTSSEKLINTRIRISNYTKLALLLFASMRIKLKQVE
jgi:15-cis-phytoene synthase